MNNQSLYSVATQESGNRVRNVVSHRKAAWLTSTAFAAISITLISSLPANAQSVALEEIVVTARKREESLQDIPLSITAITAADIEKLGVADLRDVVNLTPGLSMSEFGGGSLNFPVIRGLTNLTGGALAENNVSVFYNGVYLLNSNMVDATFLNIERIEVVKGPVSALYGRNAYSGVINYVTKRPSDEFKGTAKVIAGSHERYGVQGSVSGPIVDGKVGFSVAGRVENFGGTWEDDVSGVDFGGYKKRAVQAAVEFDPSETVNILTTFYYSDDEFDVPPRALTDGDCGAPAGAFQPTFCGKVADYDDDTESRIRSSDPGFGIFGNDRDLFLATGEISVDFGAVSLSSLTSYMDGKRLEHRDQDGTGVGYTYNLAGDPPGTVNLSTFTYFVDRDESFTEELRLSSEQDQTLRWSVGGFYSDFKRDADFTLWVDSTPVPTGRTAVVGFPIGVSPGVLPPSIRNTVITDEEYSGFGLIEFDASDRLTVSTEARYTDQTKTQNETGTFLIFGGDADGPDGVKGSWDFWSFRFTADYDLSDDTKLYASVAKGNKAGGFNATAANPDDFQYDPEENWTYEAGFKSVLNDGRLIFNATAFYADLSGLQLFSFASGGLGSAIQNAGDASTYGFEADISASIADGVSVGAGLAYSNPTFKDGAFANSSGNRAICTNVAACTDRIQLDPEGRLAISLAGLSLPRQSDWQATLTLDVAQPLTDNWDWTLRGNYRFESKQYGTSPNTNLNYVGSKHIANLRAGVENDRYAITAYVDNLFDDGTPLNYGTGLNASNFTFPISIVYGDKRTFGIEASASF